MEHGLSISNRTRVPFPRFPIFDIKSRILGSDYALSIAFIGEKESRSINKAYRGIDKPTNILTFPLRPGEGEILLCPAVIRREAREKKFGRDFRRLTGFLVIHGMLHLKGIGHSGKMEKLEEELDKIYLSRTKFSEK